MIFALYLQVHTKNLFHLKPQGKFADWSKRKIVGKGFVENVDYTSSHKIVKRDNGGNKSTEYMLTVDTAKNICMMENTDAFVARCAHLLTSSLCANLI